MNFIIGVLADEINKRIFEKEKEKKFIEKEKEKKFILPIVKQIKEDFSKFLDYYVNLPSEQDSVSLKKEIKAKVLTISWSPYFQYAVDLINLNQWSETSPEITKDISPASYVNRHSYGLIQTFFPDKWTEPHSIIGNYPELEAEIPTPIKLIDKILSYRFKDGEKENKKFLYENIEKYMPEAVPVWFIPGSAFKLPLKLDGKNKGTYAVSVNDDVTKTLDQQKTLFYHLEANLAEILIQTFKDKYKLNEKD
jgi:hypothetical protein